MRILGAAVVVLYLMVGCRSTASRDVAGDAVTMVEFKEAKALADGSFEFSFVITDRAGHQSYASEKLGEYVLPGTLKIRLGGSVATAGSSLILQDEAGKEVALVKGGVLRLVSPWSEQHPHFRFDEAGRPQNIEAVVDAKEQ